MDLSIATQTDHTQGLRQLAPRVPQELIDEIIDILAARYQRAEVNACSLVCHAWLSRSRAFIHSSIRLDISSNLERLHELYAGSHHSTEIVRYVKSLCIDVCEESGEPAEQHKWINSSLVLELLEAFPNVERLSLEGISWPQMEGSTRTAIFAYQHVKDLWVATCDFPDATDLVHLLRAFPQLESVRMEGVCADEDNDVESRRDEDCRSLTLKWLDVGDLCSRPDVVVAWAIGRERPSISIENIHITWGCSKPVALGHLLELAGSSVKTLSVTFDGRIYSEDRVAETLMLTHVKHLHNFRILVRLEKCIDDPSLDLTWITECISHLASTTLAVVRVQLEVKEIEQARFLDWKRIDVALAKRDTLIKLEICIFKRWDCVGGTDDATIGEITNAMPKLAKRGIVNIMQQWT